MATEFSADTQPFATAVSLHERGEWEAAAQAYHHALAVDPSNIEVLHGAGILALQVGDFSTSAELLRRAVVNGSHEPDTYMLLGRALKSGGDLDAALENFFHAISRAPDWADAYVQIGIVFRMQNRMAEAEVAYRQALALNANSVEAHINLGNVLHLRGDLEAAVRHYEIALELSPQSETAATNRDITLNAQAYARGVNPVPA